MSENSQVYVDFINFIAEKAKNVKSPMNLKELCEDFEKKSATYLTDLMLLYRLQRIRDKMSEMENFDTETQVKMMFALGSPVSNGFLIELRKQADVELDDQHRIIEYKKHGNGLQLSGVHTGASRSNDIEGEKSMLKFLAEKSKNVTSPIADDHFVKEFKLFTGSFGNRTYLRSRYNLIKKRIYLAPEFDQETKIKMMFLSNTRVPASILEELRSNAVVEVDEHQRITNYKANNGSLELEGGRRKLGVMPYKEWTGTETEQLLNFLVKKTKQTTVPLFIQHLSGEYAETNEIFRTKDSVALYIRKTLVPNIWKMNNLGMETRVKMLFVLSVPVDEELLNELRLNAVVEIDKKRRIAEYKANDGSLELKGDHSRGVKAKTMPAQKKSKSRISRVSETEEEIENDDDEEVDGEDEDKSNTHTTRSGRISKRRYPNNVFTCDFDAVSSDSSENVKDSIVAMLSNSSPVVPLVKHQKRKIVENSSDTISLSSKTGKHRRVANTQTDAESDETASGTIQNDAKAKCDGTEESLSQKEVKLEDEEYKPDLSSFSSNTPQDF